MKVILLVLISFAAFLSGAENEWKSLFNGKDLSGWEIKENEYASRRLDKKAITDFSVKEGAITVTSPYRSKGKFLMTKESFSHFILELEFKIPITKSNSFIGYHGQFAPMKHKQRKQDFSDLHSFTFPFGVWPKSSGVGEIRYKGTKSLVPQEKVQVYQLKENYWHKVRVEVSANRICHWIDEKLISDLENAQPAIAEIAKSSQAKVWSGPIVLGMGDHPKGVKGTFDVSWKNIRIKKIK